MGPTTVEEAEAGRAKSPRYYEKYGHTTDAILRCVECEKLAVHRDVVTKSGCPNCGLRRFKEVENLGLFEWLKIRFGILKFPFSDEFLKEFKRG